MHLYDNMSRRELVTSQQKGYHGIRWGVRGFIGGVWGDENFEREIQIRITLGAVTINNFQFKT